VRNAVQLEERDEGAVRSDSVREEDIPLVLAGENIPEERVVNGDFVLGYDQGSVNLGDVRIGTEVT
jgi:hypothetical protein